MASFKKLASGKWQAQVAKNGIRKSASFPTRNEAKDWAARQEYLARKIAPGGKMTFGTMLDMYGRRVSVKKRGARWEIIRIEKIRSDEIASIALPDLTSLHFADWRDRRLKQVAPATVAREMALMSSALNTARREWGVIATNPLGDVRKPSAPPPRDRRVSPDEVQALVAAGGTDLTKPEARTIHAFRFAIETAMRAGEITGMTWDSVNLETRIVCLPSTKNGTSRKVPLSKAALSLLNQLPGNREYCFGLNSATLDVLFRRIKGRTDIENLHFHDSRHEAITRLSKKLDVLPLARMVGHKDIRMLMVYYNETAEELASQLD